jgi:hypothetical protein
MIALVIGSILVIALHTFVVIGARTAIRVNTAEAQGRVALIRSNGILCRRETTPAMADRCALPERCAFDPADRRCRETRSK